MQKIAVLVSLGLLVLVGCGQPASEPVEAAQYEADWESLSQHPNPDWLIDAKFGIYAHWGVYSVPAFSTEWYGKFMYEPANTRGVYEHHLDKYGGPARFGYREFVPKFKAENYDPAAWAELIGKSGAKYAGFAVVHHDGFTLWDSNVNRWNAGQMGPKRDLYGELATELRQRDLKLLATFHHIRTFNWFLPESKEALERGQREGWDLFDPEYADLYWNEHTSTYEEFIEMWRAKIKEVTDKYQPDLFWFDGGEFQTDGATGNVTSILSYYLNQAEVWGREVDVLNKFHHSGKFNFPEQFGVLTYEQGRDRAERVSRPWIDDISISESAWGYKTDIAYREANHLLDGLIDRVARGGGLLLSLAPMADGTIPPGQQDILLEMGRWLARNGEAIYGTRTWKIHAEGDLAKLMEELTSDISHRQHPRWVFKKTSAEDIRFTRKGNELYAIALGWPETGKLTIETLGQQTQVSDGGIDSVTLLGAGEVEWTRSAGGLTIDLPTEKPGDHAYVFKINVKGTLAQ
jgi:alpha-L-fucosidase